MRQSLKRFLLSKHRFRLYVRRWLPGCRYDLQGRSKRSSCRVYTAYSSKETQGKVIRDDVTWTLAIYSRPRAQGCVISKWRLHPHASVIKQTVRLYTMHPVSWHREEICGCVCVCIWDRISNTEIARNCNRCEQKIWIRRQRKGDWSLENLGSSLIKSTRYEEMCSIYRMEHERWYYRGCVGRRSKGNETWSSSPGANSSALNRRHCRDN